MTRKIVLSLVVTAVLLASSLMVALIPRVSAFDPGGPPVGGAAPSVPTGNWEWINYQPTGGSYSPQTQINKDNVQYLETKWIFPYPHITKPGTLAEKFGSMNPPLIVDGTVYVLTGDFRVVAIDASSGKLLWANNYAHTVDFDKQVSEHPWLAKPAGHGHAMNYYRAQGWLIPSTLGSCNAFAVDAKTGKTAWTLTPEQMCGTDAELGNPITGVIGSLGNQGLYSSLSTHPPQFLGNIMFYPLGGQTGSGGRAFVTAFDMTDPANPKRLYREFVMPPAQGDPDWDINECKKVNGNGWYFEYPKYLEGINHPARDKEPTYLATKCTDVAPDIVKNDWIDLVPSSKTFGKLHTASAISPVWGNYPLDPETGIVYMGWGDQGPYPNLTHRYGPGLHGSGYTAHDVKTGKMVWWFNANPHDLWDYDCSWGGIIGQVQGKKAFIKGCKNGIVYAFDAATGKPFWVFDPPTILRSRGANYGVGSNNSPKDPDACCRLTKADMSKNWMNQPLTAPKIILCYTTCLESDIAYDGKRVYMGSFNNPSLFASSNVRPFGNQGIGGIGGNPPIQARDNVSYTSVTNTNIYAIDVNTGKAAWTYRVDGFGFRGGLSVTGGMVMVYGLDGNLKFLDADTGKLIHQKLFGFPVNVMPTVGATKDGKYRIFLNVGGVGGALPPWLPNVDGALTAFGLPDQLPQPQVIIKEVIKEVPKEVIKEVIKEVPKEVIKEVIKEVPKEVIKEVIKEVPKEVIKEVIKEIPKTVTVETISPISYAAIGIGVVLVVVAGVLFSRRKKA